MDIPFWISKVIEILESNNFLENTGQTSNICYQYPLLIPKFLVTRDFVFHYPLPKKFFNSRLSKNPILEHLFSNSELINCYKIKWIPCLGWQAVKNTTTSRVLEHGILSKIWKCSWKYGSKNRQALYFNSTSNRPALWLGDSRFKDSKIQIRRTLSISSTPIRGPRPVCFFTRSTKEMFLEIWIQNRQALYFNSTLTRWFKIQIRGITADILRSITSNLCWIDKLMNCWMS